VPHDKDPDERLVARYRETNDEAAFAELVRRYRGPVFRLAVSVLGQAFEADAEDVAQDVLVRVHDALPTFRGDARFGTWVYRIAFNHALNLKARARFRVPHVADAALDTAPSADRGPHEVLHDGQRRRAVQACINELPEVYQAALRLHYWLGTSVSDIAAMLDVPENTVKSYLHRARRLLSALLAERGFDAR
jgi:RNA polymerase sigma-70 factor (ECF subfamily)